MPDPFSRPGADRRTAPRLSAMRDGQLFRPDGLNAPVLIVDLSESGARLRLRGGSAPPDDLVLVDPHAWTAHRAQVMWRRDAEVGLRFLKSQSLRGVVPGALQPAKAFCERAAADPGRGRAAGG